ncbi:hypothetical protein SHAM105786_08505 [Shewanella amazonensis]
MPAGYRLSGQLINQRRPQQTHPATEAATAGHDKQALATGDSRRRLHIPCVMCYCAGYYSVTESQKPSYPLVDEIHWDEMYFRTDIGYRAIAREKQ